MRIKSKARNRGAEAGRAFRRIVDANYNRAKEALRVCEDISRFLIPNAALARAYKKSRHALTQMLMNFPASYSELLEARDSVHDAGKYHAIQDTGKPKWQDLMVANMKRAQEALRVLEEISKAVHPSMTKKFTKLRFDLYELEKKSVREF